MSLNAPWPNTWHRISLIWPLLLGQISDISGRISDISGWIRDIIGHISDINGQISDIIWGYHLYGQSKVAIWVISHSIWISFSMISFIWPLMSLIRPLISFIWPLQIFNHLVIFRINSTTFETIRLIWRLLSHSNVEFLSNASNFVDGRCWGGLLRLLTFYVRFCWFLEKLTLSLPP